MNFEDHAGLRSMAKMGLTVYRGVIEDGGTPFEASMVLTSIIAGMMVSSKNSNGNTEET